MQCLPFPPLALSGSSPEANKRCGAWGFSSGTAASAMRPRVFYLVKSPFGEKVCKTQPF